MKRICVYCASSAKIDRAFFEATERLARLFVEEEITPVAATEAELSLAALVMRRVESRFGDLLYARVDLLPAADGRPLLAELELVEPSLFHDTDPDSAVRFAAAILGHLGA